MVFLSPILDTVSTEKNHILKSLQEQISWNDCKFTNIKIDFLRDLISTYVRMHHRIPVENFPIVAFKNTRFAKFPCALKSQSIISND